jgi:hypothetical protein
MTALHMNDDRLEEDRRVATADARAVAVDLREAYERGRRDERASRRRHPIGMTLTFVAAAVGLVLLVLAAVNGSFGRGGEVVDHNLAVAMNRSPAPAVTPAAAPAAQTTPDPVPGATTKPQGPG